MAALLNKELDFTCCVPGSPLNISSALSAVWQYQVSMVPKAILDILIVIFSVTWLLLTEIDWCLAVLGFPPKI